MANFNEAIERMSTGLQQKSYFLNEIEERTVVYYEGGHAIVGALRLGAGKMEKTSIVPCGIRALGYTLQISEENYFLIAEDEICTRIATLLVGHFAEEAFIRFP
jgi:cell division protease FtsH